jgi:uncharacterized protein (DUF779 family)
MDGFGGAIMVERVTATPAALELIQQLQAEHGSIMFHQSGGCCDNSAANCYLPTDLTIGPYDIKLGEVGGVPFYIGKLQYDYWKHTQLILDVIDGHGGTFHWKAQAARRFIPVRVCSPMKNGRRSQIRWRTIWPEFFLF